MSDDFIHKKTSFVDVASRYTRGTFFPGVPGANDSEASSESLRLASQEGIPALPFGYGSPFPCESERRCCPWQGSNWHASSWKRWHRRNDADIQRVSTVWRHGGNNWRGEVAPRFFANLRNFRGIAKKTVGEKTVRGRKVLLLGQGVLLQLAVKRRGMDLGETRGVLQVSGELV